MESHSDQTPKVSPQITATNHRPYLIMKTIQAKISSKGLKKISLLFNQSPETTLNELLQNARRAKATQVEITVQETGISQCKVNFLDNGTGIPDFQKLLHLWESGWDEETQGLESPAGMGFFSLCHLPEGVTVHSLKEKTHIGPAEFEGRAKAEVQKAPHLTGTSLTFHFPHSAATIIQFTKAAAQNYPVPVLINKTLAPQEDFLKDADYVQTFKGGRIGIYEREQSRSAKGANFHGVSVPCKVASPHTGWSVKVDITDNSCLDLVLPARNAIVENTKLKDLGAEARVATYHHCAARKKHQLSYKDYSEAKQLGIKLPEAENQLNETFPQNLHSWSTGWDGPSLNTVQWNSGRKVSPKDIISALTNEEIAALHTSEKTIPVMFEENKNMAQYSWYPKNVAMKVEQVITFAKKSYTTEFESDPQWKTLLKETRKPEKIVLKLTIQTENGKCETRVFDTCIAFQSNEGGEDGLSKGWLAAKGCIGKLGVETLRALFFSPSEDGESDSYETQEEHFDKEALAEIIRRSGGTKAELHHRILEGVQTWEVQYALAQMKAKQVVLSVDEKGRATIASITTHSKGKKKS